MRFSTSRDDESILRSVFVDNVKLVVFLEFLVGTYVMPLPAELVFVPFVTFVVMLDTVAKLDVKNAAVAKITTFVLTVIGVTILGFSASRAIGDFRNLGSMNTVRTIAFPPLMSIAFVPFIYALVVIATYESVFIRLAIGREKSPEVVRYAKRRIISHCGLSLRRLRAFAKRPPFEMTQVESSADVDRLFTTA